MSILKTCKTSLTSLIVLSLIFAQVGLGDDVTYVDKGTPAPYEGFLLTVPKAKEYRLITLERDNFKTLNDSLTSEMTSLQNLNTYEQKKNQILIDQNDKLAKATQESQNMSDLNKILWFMGGVLTTSLVLYGLHQLSH